MLLKHTVSVVCLLLLLSSCQEKPLQFAISFPAQLSDSTFNGRLLLMLSDNNEAEPRFQITDGPETQLLFGIDVQAMRAGETVLISDTVLGYPLPSLTDIPAGAYYVQALLHPYETFHLSTGHSVQLPMDKGEGQQWNLSPGNLFSKPVKIHLDPNRKETVSIMLDSIIPPIAKPEDSQYIKHVTMQSKLLTAFWGRPMYLSANVLLPEGFEEHPEARYPLCVFHGHFSPTFEGFRQEPPDPALEPDYSERFKLKGYNRIQQEEAYQFYQTWTSKDFPRMLIIEIQHQNPYYDDSYAVNSANLGPYGDAITHELIPYIEEQFRGIGEGWARFLYGGSTGGWEALAAQVMYPDEYNGCFAACPDPIDFRAYTVVNIYEDTNAYYLPSRFKPTLRPGQRDYRGHVSTTLKDMNYRELVLGTNSRSGQQWDIWQAVFSPMGKNGYPQPIWDKHTGTIDAQVAAYWKENYDLRHIMERDWATLGPKLKGKIHLYCGDMDNYYLNNAVKLTEAFLETTSDPYYEGEVAYGDGAEHCWNGDPEQPNAISRLRYNTMYVPKIMKRIQESAPDGADLSSWRY